MIRGQLYKTAFFYKPYLCPSIFYCEDIFIIPSFSISRIAGEKSVGGPNKKSTGHYQ